MKELRMPLRVIFYKDDGAWIAHCLEFDLMGDGPTKPEAVKMLLDAIVLQLEASLQNNNIANLFKPADGKIFAMFAAGKDVAEGKIHLKIDSITIDETEAREYLDESSSDCGDLAYA